MYQQLLFVSLDFNNSASPAPTAPWLQLPRNDTVFQVDALSTFNFRATATYTSVADVVTAHGNQTSTTTANTTGAVTTSFRIYAFGPAEVIDVSNGT